LQKFTDADSGSVLFLDLAQDADPSDDTRTCVTLLLLGWNSQKLF